MIIYDLNKAVINLFNKIKGKLFGNGPESWEKESDNISKEYRRLCKDIDIILYGKETPTVYLVLVTILCNFIIRYARNRKREEAVEQFIKDLNFAIHEFELKEKAKLVNNEKV